MNGSYKATKPPNYKDHRKFRMKDLFLNTMKKTLGLLLSFCLIGGALAQKPIKGERSAEVNLNFQTGAAAISYNLPAELRFRYFLKDNVALRLRLGMSANNSKYAVSNPQGTVISEVVSKSGFGLSFAPGIEKHYTGTKKLSPFVGAQIGLSLNGGARKDISNCGYANPSNNLVINGDYYNSKSGSTFALNLGGYMGADYYIAEHIYLGAEFGIGLFGMSNTNEGTEKYVRLGASEVNSKTLSASSSRLFGVYSGAVRLGFIF